MAGPWEKYANTDQATAGPWAKYQPPKKDETLSWADVPGKALTNIPESAGNFVSGIANAVMHPIDTVAGLADLGAGAIRAGVQKVLPAGAFETIDNMMGTPETNKRIGDTASAVGQHLADRYGSAEGLKKAIATDPVGVAADASMLLAGGGSAMARAPGIVGRAGAAAQTAGRAIDPVTNAGRAVALGGRGAAEVLGVTTGVGTRPIMEGYHAGRTGNTAYTDAMRGNTTAGDVVDMAERGVAQMGRDRAAAYQAGTQTLRNTHTQADFAPIHQAIRDAQRDTHYRGVPIDAAAANVLDQIRTRVAEFENIQNAAGGQFPHPAPDGPMRLDALKRAVGEIRQRTQQGTLERRIADNLYRTIRDEVARQVPDYAATMRDYAQASDQIGEMRRSMSINDRATTDTTARKLLSAMRNNVNANFGERERLVNTLTQNEPNLAPALAGMSMDSWMPRGLARLGITNALGGGLTMMNPMAAAALPLQSPRLAGETAYASGRAAAGTQAALGRARMTPQQVAQFLLASGVLNGFAERKKTDAE